MKREDSGEKGKVDRYQYIAIIHKKAIITFGNP